MIRQARTLPSRRASCRSEAGKEITQVMKETLFGCPGNETVRIRLRAVGTISLVIRCEGFVHPL